MDTSAPAVVAQDSVPLAVIGVGHHAENAYDMVKTGNWAAAQAAVDSLRRTVSSLETVGTGGMPTVAARVQIDSAVQTLERAVGTRSTSEALRVSNLLTKLGADLSMPFNPRVPAEITLLDYYGRELEVWSAVKDYARLRATASAMRQTWNSVLARLDERGGTAESARFEALVARVEKAQTAADFAALADPVLTEVDNMEAVFTK